MFLSRLFIPLRHINAMGLLRYSRRAAFKKMQNEKRLGQFISDPVIESTQDVASLKNTILNNVEAFSTENIDRNLLIHFINNKQFSTALKYIQFLDEDTKNKLNLFLINQQFLIYFYKRYNDGNLSTSEQQLIIQLYNNLKQKSTILDCTSLENSILALSVTANWKHCITLLDDLKKIESPSGTVYSAVIAGAFLNDEEETAFTLLRDMFAEQKQPHANMFKAYFEKLKKLSGGKEILLHLDKLLKMCSDNNIILTDNISLELCKVLDNSGLSYEHSIVNNNGFCGNCKQKLEVANISDDVFENLKKKILENVIVGKNIFSKTTPAELSRFQKFLKTLNNVDVIIDGLNIAYVCGTNQTTKVYATLLAHVVAHFVERNKKVVVLGRKHMESWPKKEWGYVKRNADLFLTENLSLDDPYLLYCALHCGKNSTILSRDLMRSHLFLLKDPKDKIMFSRWLEQSLLQLSFVRNDGKVFFKYPRPYTRIVQHNNKHLHIPLRVVEDQTEDINKNADKWLCIRKP
ncbi:mitochondrial ribonuclease P catalytic subunit isoform X1 [Harmonia axyridis]|uniref:mitochondrial ribonuclease P catalytic subunit isoform X1 n=2 Tax=Harmonia axyridis TaxID=115357 RepID=UPI001E277CED|nr:mitochondrial ribonuclease P catalytic subunit isoform X1 [Harmonia axyridis]